MTLGEIAERLSLSVQTSRDRLDTVVTGGYASDLLSCVMSKARKGNVWVTLQSHINVVAVATLIELAGIIITEGAIPDAAVLEKASVEGIPILTTPRTTFAVVGQLFQLGIRDMDGTDTFPDA
jgi:hypothetical protein